MGEGSEKIAELEQRIEYLSTQVERLIDLHNPFPSPMTTFRKAAMLNALTFEQEALVIKLLEAVTAFNKGEKVDINQGLLPFPDETVALFNDYADKGTIDVKQVKNMIKTFIPGGDASAHNLIEAWEAVQNKSRRNNGEHQ
ncbi:hypothetical protein [Corynebacterium sp.]|uniref:hypothetical protein n=1 Tax=Corynebacterium sp. TaxID=1720 RepID=UPI0026DB9BC7|nr:hypothetical protein [Corynebacterium sp.]MDO4914729.1 hypothetical protein [Corynebacterium sp.]